MFKLIYLFVIMYFAYIHCFEPSLQDTEYDLCYGSDKRKHYPWEEWNVDYLCVKEQCRFVNMTYRNYHYAVWATFTIICKAADTFISPVYFCEVLPKNNKWGFPFCCQVRVCRSGVNMSIIIEFNAHGFDDFVPKLTRGDFFIYY